MDWFNAVDLTYRSDLRELNELNFARFEAKLEQRLADLRTELVRWMFGFWVTTLMALGERCSRLGAEPRTSQMARRG